MSGWSHVLALRVVARLAGRHAPSSREEQARAAVEMLRHLRDGGARFLTERPYVAALVDQLLAADLASAADVLVTDVLHPMNLADVSADLRGAGCTYLGDGRLGDELGVGLLPGLGDLIGDVPDVDLREALRDVAVRQQWRLDVFRKGSAPLLPAPRMDQLQHLELVALVPAVDEPAAELVASKIAANVPIDADLVRRAIAGMGEGPTPFEKLVDEVAFDGPAAGAQALLRSLMVSGAAHPTSADGTTAEVRDRCAQLNKAFAQVGDGRAPVLAAPILGSAVPSSAYEVSAVASGSILRDASSSMVRRRPLLTRLGVLDQVEGV